jgi:hypothetical protein
MSIDFSDVATDPTTRPRRVSDYPQKEEQPEIDFSDVAETPKIDFSDVAKPASAAPIPGVPSDAPPLGSMRGLPAPPHSTTFGPATLPQRIERMQRYNPQLATAAQGFIDYAKQNGVPDVMIKSDVRDAWHQRWLHDNGYPTMGNDGFIKLGPHQIESGARGIDWSTSSGQNKAKLNALLRQFTAQRGYPVPPVYGKKESWHMTLPRSAAGQQVPVNASTGPIDFSDVASPAEPEQQQVQPTVSPVTPAAPVAVSSALPPMAGQATPAPPAQPPPIAYPFQKDEVAVSEPRGPLVMPRIDAADQRTEAERLAGGVLYNPDGTRTETFTPGPQQFLPAGASLPTHKQGNQKGGKPVTLAPQEAVTVTYDPAQGEVSSVLADQMQGRSHDADVARVDRRRARAAQIQAQRAQQRVAAQRRRSLIESKLFVSPQEQEVQKQQIASGQTPRNIYNYQPSLADVRQADDQASSRASKIQERISQLVNFTGPESEEQSVARTKKILDLKGKLTGTPLGLSPQFYDFLSKDSGLTDSQITKIISQPTAPLLQFDKRGFNRFGNYDPDQDQIRNSLPESARGEYDQSVAQSVYSGPINSLWRATFSQIGGKSAASGHNMLANMAEIQAENMRSSGVEPPPWLTAFAQEQRAKSQAIHAGLERAEDVAVDSKVAQFEPNLDGVRFLSGLVPSLGEFYLAARAGSVSGQPNVAMGAYGGLTAPEFTRKSVESSVMGSQLFHQVGEASAPFGKLVNGLGTGVTTYVLAREEGATPEEATRSALVLTVGSLLHTASKADRGLEKVQKAEFLPENVRAAAARARGVEPIIVEDGTGRTASVFVNSKTGKTERFSPLSEAEVKNLKGTERGRAGSNAGGVRRICGEGQVGRALRVR